MLYKQLNEDAKCGACLPFPTLRNAVAVDLIHSFRNRNKIMKTLRLRIAEIQEQFRNSARPKLGNSHRIGVRGASRHWNGRKALFIGNIGLRAVFFVGKLGL